MSQSVTLPWPYKQVWPNFRQSHHWRAYAPYVKMQRKAAWALAKEARLHLTTQNDEIPLSVHFYPPDRRKRDRDGYSGAAKSALDGIADALGVDDSRFRPTYTVGEPVKGGSLIVTIEEVPQ